MKVQWKGQNIELPEGSSAKHLSDICNLKAPEQALAVVINGVPKDLSSLLKCGDMVQFWNFDTCEGKRVFWHTSAHVLAQAIGRLYPNAIPTIGPPIEEGFYYDFANLHISEVDFPKIEREVKNIIKENFKPEKICLKGREEALKSFGSNPYKRELINSFDENISISAYRQGEFFDLCLGPHLPNLGKIKAFKVLKTSGAYWRGDPKNIMLTRIYGISFPSQKMLKSYLYRMEESKKRDHRFIGVRQSLFLFKEEAPAMPIFLPRGMVIWDCLTTLWKEKHIAHHYEIIKTPQLMTKELWKLSGHWEHYKEYMFIVNMGEEEERAFAIKPMNCPGCMLYYKSFTHSYRELPLRIAEFGHVHRKEPSGAFNGLFRVQSFHQDDAHLFMRKDQIKDEIINVLNLVHEIYQTFDLQYSFELSTRPKKSIGTDEDWDNAITALTEALNSYGKPYQVNEGDGAFYGPKIDLHVHDAIGRRWQCGTIQLDMALPEKFALEYMDSDGKIKRPIMIHRAIFGSIERFFAILIEHYGGKFPFWLSPLPIRLISVADRHIAYAKKVEAHIRQNGFLCDIDCSAESVSKKIRTAQLLQINYMLVIGDKEVENRTVTLRTRDNIVHGECTLETFLKKCSIEQKECQAHSPFILEDQ